jgi:hypothetical protein
MIIEVDNSELEGRKELKKQAKERMLRAAEDERVQDVLDKLDLGRVRKDRKDPSRLP